MAENGKLSAKQHKAIAALLTVGTVRAAAEAAGVGERTLHTWLADGDFRAILEAAQSAVVNAHVTALIAELGRNRQAMIDIRDKAQYASTRLRAAIALDDSLRQWRGLAEFEQRVAALEAEREA